jgi:hypothetical protein
MIVEVIYIALGCGVRLCVRGRPTPRNDLQKREAALEEQLARFLNEKVAGLTSPDQGWRSALGMFTGDEEMKAIDEAGRKIRLADRRKGRRPANRANRRARR